MKQLEELYGIYDAYQKKAEDVRKKASRYAGAFGFGQDPRDHECHEAFYESVAQWVQSFLMTEPSQQEMAQAVSWILKAADAHRNTDIYGYLYAAQGHAGAMIPRLTRQDSDALLKWYETAYPEADRLPVQQKVCRLLQKQADAHPDIRDRIRSVFMRRQ